MTGNRVWTSIEGEGETVVLLHPGGTDSRAMQPLADALPGHRILLVDRPGHGRSPDVDGAWSFAAMADAVADVIASSAASPVHVVGWSDGAIVGLHLALRHPDAVRSLVFGGAAFHHSGWRDGVLGGEPPVFMADAYAEVSPDGGAHWAVVTAKADELHVAEPDVTVSQLAVLDLPTLIVVGDDDEVRWDHLLEMYEALPDGELAVVPRATHGLLVEKPDLLAQLIVEFHRPDRGDGVAPIRRAGR